MNIYNQIRRYYDALLKKYKIVWSRWCSTFLLRKHSFQGHM